MLDSPDRLRDTLVHEMCHAASWVISGYKDGHGPIWKNWATRAMIRFPELPIISRCHSYEIRTKYVYRCQTCSNGMYLNDRNYQVQHLQKINPLVHSQAC